MTEPKNNKNDHPTEQQQPSDENQTELREISEEELKQIIEDHKKWVESDGKEGKIADFTKKNLQDANIGHVNLQGAYFGDTNLINVQLPGAILKEGQFSGANLQSASLIGANLQQTNFSEANLQNARLWNVDLQCGYLSRANLQSVQFDKANLKEANFKEANLEDSNLTETKLHLANFMKANLQRANLENAVGFATANLQYANLTGATGLLGNEFAQADLTGTKLPKNIEEFKALETVKETSQNARKIFFAMLLGSVYSWLTIATTTDVRLLTNTASSPLPIIQTEIPIAGFYWAAPLVLICLYFYFHLYLLKLWEGLSGLPAIFPDGKRLDERAYPWLLNGLVRRHFKRLKTGRPFIAHIAEWITILLAWCVVPFTMMAFWLRYIPRHDSGGTIFHIGLIVLSFAFAIIFYRLCALTLKGKEKVSIYLRNFWRVKRFYYSILKLIIFSVFIFYVGLFFLLISMGAFNWFETEKPQEFLLDTLYGIEQEVPLAFYKLGYNVFADFREKKVSEIPSNYALIAKEERLEFVKGANLKNRSLNNANMEYAFLVKADFRNTNLKKAELRGANLQKADLGKANLQQAYLWDANLKKAELRGANLQKAKLRGANLQQADLGKANLQESNLSNANLQQANLFSAKLQKAYLVGAYLQEANFEYANLQEASFSYADLTGAKNLTIYQLSKVKTLYKAKLDPELLVYIQSFRPHLLEKPKDEQNKIN